MQTVVVGWLTARGGVRATLTAMWALCAVSFGDWRCFRRAPCCSATQVIRRGGDYGLFKPAREMLFTVLSPETKFKSKSLLDTVLHRGADSVGNGLYVLSRLSGSRVSRPLRIGMCLAGYGCSLAGGRFRRSGE